MVNINGVLYASRGVDDTLKKVVRRLKEMTNEEIVNFLNDGTLKGTVVDYIDSLSKEIKYPLDIRVTAVALGLLSEEHSDNKEAVVFLLDLVECASDSFPTSLKRILKRIYPNGFYTETSLKERIEWLVSHESLVKYPQLVRYLKEN